MKLVLVLLLFAVSCRVPPRHTTVGAVIRCSADAVQSNWPRILPAVNTCLGDETVSDVTGCLLALVNPATGITEDVVACLVRERGSDAFAAAQANPRDARSSRAATRAHGFILAREYRFE